MNIKPTPLLLPVIGHSTPSSETDSVLKMGHLGLCIAFTCLAITLISAAPTGQPGQEGWFVNWEEEAIKTFFSDIEGEYRWIYANEGLSKVEAVSTTVAQLIPS